MWQRNIPTTSHIFNSTFNSFDNHRKNRTRPPPPLKPPTPEVVFVSKEWADMAKKNCPEQKTPSTKMETVPENDDDDEDEPPCVMNELSRTNNRQIIEDRLIRFPWMTREEAISDIDAEVEHRLDEEWLENQQYEEEYESETEEEQNEVKPISKHEKFLQHKMFEVWFSG